MNPTREIADRRARDAKFRPGTLDARHVLPAIPAPAEPHLWERADAVRVPPPTPTTGRPPGEYEARACCTDATCSGEWWFLPDSPTQFRSYLATEQAKALTRSVGTALLAAEAAGRRLERTLATLDEEQYAR
jgi:hypothetical protein